MFTLLNVLGSCAASTVVNFKFFGFSAISFSETVVKSTSSFNVITPSEAKNLKALAKFGTSLGIDTVSPFDNWSKLLYLFG